MESIVSDPTEVEIPKTETSEVFEAGGIREMECPEDDGHSSEKYDLAKNSSSVESVNVEPHESSESGVIANVPVVGDAEVAPIPCPDTEPSENSQIVESAEAEPVNIEKPPFIDFNELAKKTLPPSNKRKSDNHTDSSIEEKKCFNMRKNIRGIINENFDTITIAAQREESERLARVQSLKKSVKQSFLNTGLEAMDEDIPYDVDLLNDESMASSEAMEPQAVNSSQQLRRQLFDLKENKLQRVAERRFDKKLWSQWLSAERSSAAAEEKGEVVTIDSSSDDDCIILSDSDDGAEDDPEDDHHNSGLHVRDVLNIPNEHGKVLVNVGHVENEPDIYVAPQIAKVIKPHQIGGVRFLFDNIIESTKRFNNSSGFGCILAHSMGLGKTLQVVCFSDIFLRHTESKTILCVMPINTIQNWVKEFNLWLPEESDDHEKVRPRQFSVYALNDQHKTLSSRSNVILKWAAKGGVLLIGYELFRVLGMKIIKKKDIKKPHESAEHKRLLDQIQMALVKPGPDLVICDEGHRIKNAHAGISIALKQIRSRRRIVLTGYPLQNNLLEYWCMVDFVRPNYLGSKTEFCNMFERPIQNGQCIDSTPGDIKLMRYRAHVLHSLLVGFVQRRSDSVLQNSLPQKMEYVILTKMTKLQRELYDAFMNEVVRKKKVPNPLKAFAVCCKIWNHPDVLYNFLKKRESDYDLDIDEEATVKSNLESAKATKAKADVAQLVGEADVPLLKEPDNESVFANDQKPFSENPNPNAFWQDGMSSSQPPKPDYVGLMAKPPQTSATNGETAKCSSQIVDLDTKEVQFIKSDIPTNLEVNSLASAGNAKPAAKIDAEFQGGNGHIKPLKNDVKPGTESISYDWALNIMKNYEPGIVSNSPKMEIFMYILEESIKMGDRVLVFSQSLLTLNLMEYFLQSTTIPETEAHWKKNTSYFRLDGSTSSLEREKLVNEFNSNTDVKLFLISTRAGSLGINLTGANRVVVFDASWNPCHDTQAVHRIYRYGQRKCCFVYRIVMDNCMEKNIYDRQVKKQGMSDRVVDECNPDAHLSIRELTNLCYDKIDEEPNVEFKQPLESYSDVVMRKIITNHKDILSKEPFYHESLLIDRKDKKLSQTEKKLAKRGYEIEKKASSKPTFLPNNFEYKIIQNRDGVINKGVTQIHQFKKQVREPIKGAPIKLTRWIPAEVWQRQGMSSQEMMLPIDVAIPTNSSETSNIVVKAGEKVMVLNSPKGVYMQLESGKIIAIKTSAEALDKDKLKARKLGCPELFGKRPLPIDPKIFREAKPPCPDDDKDDVIVINDSINDAPSVSSFDLPFSKQKTRKDLIPVKRCIIPQLNMRHKSNLPPAEIHKAKQDAFNVRTHREFVKPPQTVSAVRPNFPEKSPRTPREFGQAAPSHLPQQRNNYAEKNFRANQEFVQPSLIETSPNPHYVDKDLRTHQEFVQPVLTESPPRSHFVEKSLRTHQEFTQPPLAEPLPRTNNYAEKIPRPHQEFPQSYPTETAVPANYSNKNLRPHHEYSHPAASEPLPRTNYVDKNLRTHPEFQAPIPTEAGTSYLEKSMRPLQDFPHPVPLVEHSPRNNYLEKSLRTHQEFEPPHQVEPTPVTDYGEKDRSNMYGNVLHNPNYEIPPAHNLESQHLPPMPSRWENKSPEMYKQAVKISNIPAPYPSTSICDLSAFEKNDKPQESDIINVDQYNPSYTQPPSKDSDDHAFHHNMNLGSNYYNNSLSTNPTTTEDNGSLNTLYNYNNKNESNYSENLYENADPSSHANYHQDMSKYSYGYYQPQYLPNFNNKAYDSNAFSSVSTQYYMRRPTTYSTSSANGVDVGLNYTEPQGWAKKHLPD